VTLLTEPVTRLRPATYTDPYSGESTVDWSQPPVETSLTALVADSGSIEQILDGRTPVDSDFTLYFEAAADVTASDRMRVRGLICSVTGRPFDWRPGTVVQVKVREG
jgi:head-tail adaptor